MRKTVKIIAAVFVGLIFLASVALCSCAVKSAHVFGKKISCSDCASKAQPTPLSHECCLTKTIPMDAAKNLVVSMPLFSWWPVVMASLLYIVPRPHIAFRTAYLNGPPGLVSLVPLYIQSRSLRI
ncbi:MAG: hypothetical protein HY209_03735 [Candidatus Omnitrophica bacterium]|nr:hypothetical protein [Candidatus Omnitrophota bacterium]